jgi:hypothetical protein
MGLNAHYQGGRIDWQDGVAAAGKSAADVIAAVTPITDG